jgi:hypothetical protein
MNSVLKLVFFTFLFSPATLFAEKVVEIDIDKINSLEFGENVWASPDAIIGKLNGKHLGNVLLYSMDGYIRFNIAVCNVSENLVKVDFSAAIFDANKERLWHRKNKIWDFHSGYCGGAGFILPRPNDYEGVPEVSKLKFPLKIKIKYTES